MKTKKNLTMKVLDRHIKALEEAQPVDGFYHLPAATLPPRFRTRGDGLLFLECYRTGRKFPSEKWVWPYEMKWTGFKRVYVMTKEYREAQFEIQYLTQYEHHP